MNPSRPSQLVLPALTGVRAFAAFWVLLHMLVVIGALVPDPYASIARFFGPAGSLGVDVFFVLSGFIISYNHAEIFGRGITLGSAHVRDRGGDLPPHRGAGTATDGAAGEGTAIRTRAC
jgi:peptidoglycan/LPS O-acetylase OafA/YrhL